MQIISHTVNTNLLGGTTHGDRVQLISLGMADLVKLALEAALNDGNGLAGINDDTEVSFEIETVGHHGEPNFTRFEMGLDFDIVRDLDGSLRVIETDHADHLDVSAILMIVNSAHEEATEH